MATPTFCCGFECGLISSSADSTAHWVSTLTTPTISTTTVRSGSRSLRINVTGGSSQAATKSGIVSSQIHVFRFYVRFETLPGGDTSIARVGDEGVYYQQSDSTLRCGADIITFGATGVTVTTGQWYCVDVRINASANPHTIDAQVDGVALGQAQAAVGAATGTSVRLGDVDRTRTYDMFFDDVVYSATVGDYPFGPGKVEHFVPTADGTHNVAGANDFERSATGTDITNATTTAYQLIDDVPIKSGSISEYINLIAPPNATDYVEVVFGPAPGISTPTDAPRAVETIIVKAKGTGTGTNNLRIALNDNGTTNDIFNGDTTTSSPTADILRKHYSDPPSAATAWTVVAGNGNFNNVRMRCYTSDAAPDPWWASAMIEAEFEDTGAPPPSFTPRMMLMGVG